MARRRSRGITALIGLSAAALALFGVTAAGQAAVTRHAAAAAVTAPSSTVPAWTGTFDNFHTSPWTANWGTTSDTAQCQGAAGAFTCNWGYGNLHPMTDSTAPGTGQVLQATYPANSGPPSCFLTVSGCVLGGGQFYQDLTTNGQSALAQSPSLDLKYYYKFPVGFDFGGKTQGKMPGLWGGGVPGCESGAQHCANGWSTRYMWKGGSSTAPNGELYFYTAAGSGFGADLCNGNWHFPADGKWHSIEQLANVQTGSITIWSDGANVCQVTEPLPGAHSGVFFSTFHGGHDASFSPSKTVTDEFADFTLATDGPQSTGGPTAPATPTGVTAAGTSSSTIALNWSETGNGDAATSYKVYEGTTVVATPTGTSATISGLTAGSTHTYTVTAVDAAGKESPHSAAATGRTGSQNGPFSQTLLDSAVAAPLFAWAAPTSSVPRPGTNPANIGESKVVYYLALVDRQAPGTLASNGTSVHSALLAQIRSLIAGGHEPDADGGLEMWGQAPIAQALLLVKDSPTWSELTSAEQNKVTLLEAAMGYGSNYTYNDANNFPSGICGFGNFSKTNNPNYRDGGVDTEIAVIQFFGASTWDGMLTSFNDATFASQLNSAGLTNAGACFNTVGSGGNSAIARPFVYSGHHSSDLMGIWSTIAGNTFDKTAQSTVSPAHIADNTTSPYDGQCCMGHEFNSTDSSGLRSSALYTFEGWMNVTGSRVSMEVLGNFNIGAASSEQQYHIGTLDLKYKLDHGYISQALNQTLLLVDDHGNPSADGPNVKGFLYDWDAYTVSGAPGNGFSISASPASGSVTRGSSASTTVSTAVTSGNAQSVALSASGLPAGATATLTPATVTAGGSSTLSVATTSSTPTGTYPITVTGSGASATHTATYTLTVTTPNACTPAQLLGNPGFENGTNTAPWAQTSTLGYLPITNASGESPHTGTWKAWFNGNGTTDTDTAAQTVTIPTGCKATLTYWLHIDTTENTTTATPDTFKVQLLNSGGTVLTTLATYSNLNKNTGFTQHTIDISAYAGQTVTLKFTGTETDKNGGTTNFVDDDNAVQTS